MRSAPTLKIWMTPFGVGGDAGEIGAVEDRASLQGADPGFRLSTEAVLHGLALVGMGIETTEIDEGQAETRVGAQDARHVAGDARKSAHRWRPACRRDLHAALGERGRDVGFGGDRLFERLASALAAMCVANRLEQGSRRQPETTAAERRDFGQPLPAAKSERDFAREADRAASAAEFVHGARHEAGGSVRTATAELENVLRLKMAAADIDRSGARRK
jgi:hypothetical protein